ncbi:sugar ABC transporter substrate-binding protein [Crassaminicella thermophila]|uniref:Sugar ABC transporter substrate-binding protein n=1 Tax=Crassaminicella thermophila TaxID=2599308 RepID=A0A5C0SD26_CRATE|nr:sugar ABC transporter substrate-binding protein [Crassaminicella thermophila]QEK11787.1 sugar ABC transporter substrate-binding protein [Crassaminicella thermophila]
MKKLNIWLVICLLLIAILAGCSSAENNKNSKEVKKEEHAIKIGVSISDFDDVWLMYMKDAMESYGKTLGGKVEVVFVDGKDDANKQLAQVENFIAQEFDVIVVNPVNTQATQPMTDAALQAGVKLVYVNRLPDYLPEGVTFVGSDSVIAGNLQMEYLAEKLNGKGNVVIMQGSFDSEATYNRTDGVKMIADKYPNIHIIKVDTANFSREEGMMLMENWLSTGDQIDAVAANNDEMAIGAIQAIEAAGKLGEILVGGIDATPEALSEMEKGRLACTIFQDATGQGEGAIKAAYNLAIGKNVEQKVWIPFQLVTPENIDKFKK